MSYAASRFSNTRRPAPLGMVVIVALHGIALYALATAQMDLSRPDRIVTSIFNVPVEPPPDPATPPPPDPRPATAKPQSAPSQPQTLVPIPTFMSGDDVAIPDLPPTSFDPPTNLEIAPPNPPPVGEIVAARFATPDALVRPPFPDSKRRLGEEASLRLQLTIDARGRVVAVEPIGSVDPAFLTAARAHILRYWRYQPAREDGRAVTSTARINLAFRLDDD